MAAVTAAEKQETQTLGFGQLRDAYGGHVRNPEDKGGLKRKMVL